MSEALPAPTIAWTREAATRCPWTPTSPCPVRGHRLAPARPRRRGCHQHGPSRLAASPVRPRYLESMGSAEGAGESPQWKGQAEPRTSASSQPGAPPRSRQTAPDLLLLEGSPGASPLSRWQ
ncbi:hypothetical protein MRB53_017421 [Persea americana]|uniref:Uncharacterized protein n=1 Tax=Persea americana TaxID=3435 RepID=A0ACC2M6D6_PERAE|nr:hypothetical protein MRB53_017421 [Persea americana]